MKVVSRALVWTLMPVVGLTSSWGPSILGNYQRLISAQPSSARFRGQYCKDWLIDWLIQLESWSDSTEFERSAVKEPTARQASTMATRQTGLRYYRTIAGDARAGWSRFDLIWMTRLDWSEACVEIREEIKRVRLTLVRPIRWMGWDMEKGHGLMCIAFIHVNRQETTNS